MGVFVFKTNIKSKDQTKELKNQLYECICGRRVDV